MVKLFILVKQKGAKKALGAIPIKSGLSKGQATSLTKKQLKPGFLAKVITEAQLRTLLQHRAKKGTTKRKVRVAKRRTKRRKKRR